MYLSHPVCGIGAGRRGQQGAVVRDASKRGEGHGAGLVYPVFLPKMPYGRKVHWFQKVLWKPSLDRGPRAEGPEHGQRTWV